MCHELSELYDASQYQMGLTKCKKGLSKYHDHPEILGWQAVFLYMTGQKQDGLDLMATTVRGNMRNAKVWKLNGVLMKEKGDYMKALQSYTQAHRLDESDDGVVMELCNLHLYERNIPQFVQFATKILKLKGTVGCMLKYSLAMFLSGRYETCVKFLNTFEENCVITEDDAYFNSELRLFHGKVLLSLKRWRECVEYLTGKSRIEFRDKVTVKEFLAQCYVALNEKENAMKTVEELLSEYPENGDYFALMEKLLERDEYLEHLMKMEKSNYAKVRVLEMLDVSDDRFEGLLSSYMKPLLVKGAPFLFVNLKDLSEEKLDVAVKIAKGTEVPLVYEPIVKLFVACVLSARKKYKEALSLIEEGIEHTPTIVELIVMKVKILRKLGMADQAVLVGKQLSEMDPNDRNSMTIYASALLKGGRFKTAFEVAEPWSIFQDKKPRLMSTQYNDWHLKCADSAYDGHQLDMAAKLYRDVVRHFEEYRRAQYNFIMWQIRCISSIFDILKWADELEQHPILARALVGLMKIGFVKQDKSMLEQAALKALHSTVESALAYACVYFAKNNEPLPALKACKKIKGSWRFACGEALRQMFASGLDKIPAVVKEVATEEYEPLTGEPATFDDHIALARGHMFVGDLEKSEILLKKALSEFEFSYAQARDAYQLAGIEMGKQQIADVVVELVAQKYPTYQLRIEFEEAPLPKELDYEQ